MAVAAPCIAAGLVVLAIALRLPVADDTVRGERVHFGVTPLYLLQAVPMYAAAIFLAWRAPRRGRVGRWLLAVAAICAVLAPAWLLANVFNHKPWDEHGVTIEDTIVRPDTGAYLAGLGYVLLLVGVALLASRSRTPTSSHSVSVPRRPIAAAGRDLSG